MISVLDASVTIARVDPAELTDAIAGLFDQVDVGGGVVPPLWEAEVANVLQTNVRKGRYTVFERNQLLQDIRSLNITIDSKAGEHLWTTTIELAHRHGLSIYDAIYLDCAIGNKLPLATLDKKLRAAATAEGIPLLGL